MRRCFNVIPKYGALTDFQVAQSPWIGRPRRESFRSEVLILARTRTRPVARPPNGYRASKSPWLLEPSNRLTHRDPDGPLLPFERTKSSVAATVSIAATVTFESHPLFRRSVFKILRSFVWKERRVKIAWCEKSGYFEFLALGRG